MGPVTGGSRALGTDTGRRGPLGQPGSRGPRRGLPRPPPRKSPARLASGATGDGRRPRSRPGTRRCVQSPGDDGECPCLGATAGRAGRLCGRGTGSPRRPASRLGLGASLGSGNQVPGADPARTRRVNSLLRHLVGADSLLASRGPLAWHAPPT